MEDYYMSNLEKKAEKKSLKQEIKEANKKNKESGKNLWKEFKAFIARGNALDMAVGVVIGGAFGAIVTAVVNILLSVCTWGVPGGLKGLVTVLPAANSAQAGIDGIGQTFAAGDVVNATIAYAASQGITITADSTTFITWENALFTKYTLHGSTYFYNLSAIIDWGTLLNTVISFLIIAATLFIILKIFKYLSTKRTVAADQAKERYYKQHPEERPAPIEE